MDIRSISNSNKKSINIPMEGNESMNQKLYFESDYSKELIYYVNGLIEFEGKRTPEGYELDISSLSESDLIKFSAHLIQKKSKEQEGWDWLMDSSIREEMANHMAEAFLSYGDKKEEILKKFNEDLIKTSIHEFKEEMQGIVDMLSNKTACMEMRESGHILMTHNDNGETFWAKVA